LRSSTAFSTCSSSRITQFIFNFHNQVLHSTMLQLESNQMSLYRYSLCDNFRATRTLSKLAAEIRAIGASQGGQGYDWLEYQFYCVYRFGGGCMVPYVMDSSIKKADRGSRLYREDLSLHYLHGISSEAETPMIDGILEKLRFGELVSEPEVQRSLPAVMSDSSFRSLKELLCSLKPNLV